MKNDFQKAKNVCLRLLKYRLRSEKELRDRLTKKKFDNITVNKAIAYFKEIGLVNDAVFAKQWIESRLDKGLGAVRIKKELKEKGIDSLTADELLKEKLKDAPEQEKVRQVIEKKLKAMHRGEDLEKLKRRIFAFLVRRGFSYDLVYEEIKKAFNDH